MIDLNKLSEQTFKNAIKRGKTDNSNFIDMDSLNSEVLEVFMSRNIPSEHIPDFSETQEELADVLIVCMSELRRRNTNIEKLLIAKIEYNERR